MAGDTWVFGYGSLVSPASLATTIERTVAPADVAVATLHGYGRRWNYGAGRLQCSWTLDGVEVDDGVMVALGLVRSEHESCNGVAFKVTPTELEHLDRRERNYDRTDITDLITLDDPVPGVATASPSGATFVTYVPRAGAIEHYETARDAGRAAIRQSYWDLVLDAFETLGGTHPERYATTPQPDVPVVEMTWNIVG
ncbi:MAG: gamma-glutamylcyclotransferase family protein [Ilumatobacteraceae bacterium]